MLPRNVGDGFEACFASFRGGVYWFGQLYLDMFPTTAVLRIKLHHSMSGRRGA